MEDKIKEDIKDFAQFIFNYFRESYNSWDTLNSILAELDCLCSLSVVSFYSDGIMCRPNLLPLNDVKGPKINFEETRHPCVCMTGIDFIPNDIKIGFQKKLM